MKNYIIDLPVDFSDYEWEYEAKGCLETTVQTKEGGYTFNFYDKARFNQDIEFILHEKGYAFDKNVVILKIVNLKNITTFLDSIIGTNELFNFVKNS